MKRAFLLLFIILLCVAGFLYIWGFLPFLPAVEAAIVMEIRSLGPPVIIFTAVIVILLGLFLYRNDIIAGFRRRYRESVSPIIEESHRVGLVLSNRFEHTEKAIEFFAGAMQQYAEHLDSHTTAIRGLGEASQALKDSAVAQTRILHRLSHTLDRGKPEEEISGMENVVSDLEKRTQMVLQVMDELESKKTAPDSTPPPAVEPAPPGKISEEISAPFPPGCLAHSRATYKKWHDSGKSAT
jgi:hypothetical protein